MTMRLLLHIASKSDGSQSVAPEGAEIGLAHTSCFVTGNYFAAAQKGLYQGFCASAGVVRTASAALMMRCICLVMNSTFTMPPWLYSSHFNSPCAARKEAMASRI